MSYGTFHLNLAEVAQVLLALASLFGVYKARKKK